MGGLDSVLQQKGKVEVELKTPRELPELNPRNNNNTPDTMGDSVSKRMAAYKAQATVNIGGTANASFRGGARSKRRSQKRSTKRRQQRQKQRPRKVTKRKQRQSNKRQRRK